MKRWIAGVLSVLCMFFVFTGCHTNKEKEPIKEDLSGLQSPEVSWWTVKAFEENKNVLLLEIRNPGTVTEDTVLSVSYYKGDQQTGISENLSYEGLPGHATGLIVCDTDVPEADNIQVNISGYVESKNTMIQPTIANQERADDGVRLSVGIDKEFATAELTMVFYYGTQPVGYDTHTFTDLKDAAHFYKSQQSFDGYRLYSHILEK